MMVNAIMDQQVPVGDENSAKVSSQDAPLIPAGSFLEAMRPRV
jgi:hypothetical protein